ncbi:MAG: hypothetical protein K0Q49_468 [Haloplasmataceae bacterium]|jgi:hypothetical protein|nr:hypothetical protein [Haloplasmataceae bacterium]
MAYDYRIDPEETLLDIESKHEYLLAPYQRKYGKYQFIDFRKDPLENELDRITESISTGLIYHDGLHINSTYTALAHYWLINNMLKVKDLNIVVDNDDSLLTALKRVFKDKIKTNDTKIFVTTLNKKIKKDEAKEKVRNTAFEIEKDNTIINENLEFNLSKYEYTLSLFYEEIKKTGTYDFDGGFPMKPKKTPYILPKEDEGERFVWSINNLSQLSIEQIAKLYYLVNTVPLNGYHNNLRKRLFILDRANPSSKSEKKDYAHAPKKLVYVQKELTIFRTWHNFCNNMGYASDPITPAMKLGITDRQYTIREIIFQK